jgi:hypothetical protein
MAIAIDGSSPAGANGTTSQASVTTASFTPPNGSLLVARGSCYASSGDDTSQNAITDSAGLTWTKRVERTQNQDGGGITPPPITIWTAPVVTGTAMTVTTSAPAGTTGFAHMLKVWVITGHDTTTPVVDTAEESTVAGMALTLDTPVAGCLLLGGMCDWGNTSDVPDEDANSTTDYALANADIQSSWAGHRVVGAAGSYVIGTDTLASPAGTNAIAIALQPAAAGAEVFGSAALSAESSLTAAALVNVQGAGALSAQTVLTAAGFNTALGGAALSAEASFTASGIVTQQAAAALTAESGLTAVGLVNQRAAASLAAESGMTAAAVVTVFGVASLSAQSSLAATAAGSSVIVRPNTGTITRPFTGTITRP